MENNIISFLKMFFDVSNRFQRWIILLLLIVVLMISLQEYEKLTGNFQLSKIEKKVSLLKELQLMSNKIKQNPELEEIYLDTVKELSTFESSQSVLSNLVTMNLNDIEIIGKAISGGFIFFITAILGLIRDIRDKTVQILTLVVVVILIFAGMFLAWVGTIIPTLYNPWVNYVGFPIVQLVLLFLLLHGGVKIEAKQKNSSKVNKT